MKLPSQKTTNILLRISVSLVFLYFGINQAMLPDNWAGFVPDFLTTQYFSANNIVVLNGMMEITLGMFLMMGLYTRFASLILSLHLFGIAFSLINTPTGIRDLGLAIMTLAVFFNGPDKWCLDTKMKK